MEEEKMTGIKVSNLGEEFSWGAKVEGINWDTLSNSSVRAELNDVFERRGLIVFSDCEPSQKMHVAISTVFGPLKDHPTKTTARVDQDSAPGVIDMYCPGSDNDD